MVLEDHVVLVCGAADAPEDVALHELVHIGPKPVDNLPGAISVFGVSIDEGQEHTSWSSQMFSCAIWPLTCANGSVEYLCTPLEIAVRDGLSAEQGLSQPTSGCSS